MILCVCSLCQHCIDSSGQDTKWQPGYSWSALASWCWCLTQDGLAPWFHWCSPLMQTWGNTSSETRQFYTGIISIIANTSVQLILEDNLVVDLTDVCFVNLWLVNGMPTFWQYATSHVSLKQFSGTKVSIKMSIWLDGMGLSREDESLSSIYIRENDINMPSSLPWFIVILGGKLTLFPYWDLK